MIALAHRARPKTGAHSSTSTFAKMMPECVIASSSNTGAIILHGPHHWAVKSTIIGLRSASSCVKSNSECTWRTPGVVGDVVWLWQAAWRACSSAWRCAASFAAFSAMTSRLWTVAAWSTHSCTIESIL